MARIIEDLEDVTSLRLLLCWESSSSSMIQSPTDQYFDMLRYMYHRWDLYKRLKEYIAQLRWSCWSLCSPSAVDPLIDFWKAEGILGFDMFDICSMALLADKMVGQIITSVREQMWEFGEGDIVSLLNTISPEFAQVADATARTKLNPLVRGYVTHLVFSKGQNLTLHPEPLLNMLKARPELFEATKMSLTILWETCGTKGELTSYILRRLRRPYQAPDWKMLTFLLGESFADSASVIAVIHEAQLWSMRGNYQRYETCRRFLIPCAAILCRYTLETDLCDALVREWEAEPDDNHWKVSALVFLCETCTLLFKDTLKLRQDQLIVTNDYPRTREARTELARLCLLGAMRAVAPWTDSLEDLDDDQYLVQVLAPLQLLWSSRPSGEDMAHAASELAIPGPLDTLAVKKDTFPD